MHIQVLYKRVWGKQRFYALSEDAKTLIKITGKPTLSHKQLKICLSVGWKVDIIQPKIDINSFLGEDEKKRISRDDMSRVHTESTIETRTEFDELPDFDISSKYLRGMQSVDIRNESTELQLSASGTKIYPAQDNRRAGKSAARVHGTKKPSSSRRGKKNDK